MPFIRVKSAVESDPQHEFDVSVAEFEANPSLYAVVDAVPVDDSRPPRYVKRKPKPEPPKPKRK